MMGGVIDSQGRRRVLIAMLSEAVDEVAEAALRHCEEAMPLLSSLPGRDRQAGLAVMKFATRLRLEVAIDGREPNDQEAAYLRDYFAGAAERGIPLDVQLQIVRRTIAFTMSHYWESAGPEHTDALLGLSALTSRFHHRLEQLLVDAYCQRLGTDVAAERLRKAYADALLSGHLPPPTAGTEMPLSSRYLVLVVPGRPGSPPPLAALMTDDRVLHTVRDGADVTLVPAEPDGLALAEKLALRARDAGRESAVATLADSPNLVPQAYERARRLKQASAALRDAPVLVMPEDALPERLLGTDPEVAAELADVLARVVATPGLHETLTTFLDSDMDRTSTAERLHIHRRTLTQRLYRIRELTGYDPRTSRGVQVLSLALAARRMRTDHPASG
jgi:hypothetical protein